ncbi:MAG: Pvc16 family protein [Bacteroidota bacterium]
MDYTTLDEITETIITVIQQAISHAGYPVDVIPELVTKEKDGVSFYLYHVQENSHYKNYPPAGTDHPPVSITPMGLSLFYQLTCNKKKVNSEEDAYEEQMLMSIAMKALHDMPVRRTTLKNAPAGSYQQKDIDIKISMQHLTPAESIQYWAAAESAVRLSSYYEVSVVFLQPEVPTSISGRVLSYGNFIFTDRAPRITASENTMEYLVPGDPNPRQVTIRPAQAMTAGAGPPSISSRIRFSGSGFTGKDLTILILSPLWNEPALVSGSAWDVAWISETAFAITLQPTAVLVKSGTIKNMIPGLYSAEVCKTEQRSLPGGTIKKFEQLSNLFPFSVIPSVDSFLPGLPGIYDLTGYLFYDPDLDARDVQVYLGEEKLSLNPAGATTGGEFTITGPAPGTISLIPPPGIHGSVALRVMVRGIESQPKWVNIP